MINWLWQRDFILSWVVKRQKFFLFICCCCFFSPPTIFYFLPIVQWHQVLLWCCHRQTLSGIVTCCSHTQILLFICFKYFCQVTTQLRGRGCMFVTYEQKEWQEGNALLSCCLGWAAMMNHRVLFRERQSHLKTVTVLGMWKGGARTTLPCC